MPVSVPATPDPYSFPQPQVVGPVGAGFSMPHVTVDAGKTFAMATAAAAVVHVVVGLMYGRFVYGAAGFFIPGGIMGALCGGLATAVAASGYLVARRLESSQLAKPLIIVTVAAFVLEIFAQGGLNIIRFGGVGGLTPTAWTTLAMVAGSAAAVLLLRRFEVPNRHVFEAYPGAVAAIFPLIVVAFLTIRNMGLWWGIVFALGPALALAAAVTLYARYPDSEPVPWLD